MTPAPDSPFQPFRQVLEARTAGYHDGQRSAVDLNYFSDPVVVHHEGTHERIFFTTPDGQALSLLLQLQQYGKSSGKPVPPAVGTLVERLIQGSRFAHEVVATYLAIKQYSPGPGEATYARLPQDYLAYYHALADVIDVPFPVTYLQYLIGTSLYAIAFSSLYLARLAKADLATPPVPEALELPDERMKRLIDTLRRGDLANLRRKMEAAAAAECQRLNRKLWDLHSDDEWQQNRDIGTEVELVLTGVLRPWLQVESALPVLPEGEPHRAVLLKILEVFQPYGLDVRVPSQSAMGEEFEEGLLDYEAFWQGNSMIVNDPVMTPVQGDDRIFGGANLFESLRAFQILSTEPPTHLTHWIFIAWQHPSRSGEEARQWAGRFSAAALMDWLARRRDREKDGLPVPHARSITVAVRNWQDFNQIMTDLMDRVSIVDERGIRGAAAAVVAWYWLGNWVEALREWAEYSPMEMTAIRLGHGAEETAGAEALPGVHPGLTRVSSPSYTDWTEVEPAAILKSMKEPVIKILKAKDVPGWIVRVLTPRADALIFREEDRLRKAGRLTNLDDELSQIAAYAAINALEFLRLLWSRF